MTPVTPWPSSSYPPVRAARVSGPRRKQRNCPFSCPRRWTYPDIAPLLILGAVTGIRRGDVVGITRSGVAWRKNQITVPSAIISSGKVKTTKTRRSWTFHIDAETTAMLKRHCDLMDERAAAAGVEMAGNPFLFSLAEDCSTPMPPGTPS